MTMLHMDITLGSLTYYQTQYEDENVNIENIVEAFSSNSIIIWHGYGSINDVNGSYLLTGMYNGFNLMFVCVIVSSIALVVWIALS